jgi:hypothetical protein
MAYTTLISANTPIWHSDYQGIPNDDEITGLTLFLLATEVREERASDEILASLARNPKSQPLSTLISCTCASSFFSSFFALHLFL